jgi:pSer/pThr/pTyr-binding forkhead associated (FHA) protein
MQVVLVMFRGENDRRSFSIVHDVTVIGRREDCDFRIPLGEISRKHCRLIKDGDSLRAEDLGSSNGTYVNGNRVQEAELAPGDTLKVGSVVFVVQIDGVPDEADMHPAAAPVEVDDLLEPQAEVTEEGEMPTQDIDEFKMDDSPVADESAEEPASEPASEEASEDYDPMSVLGADPDASSLGSALDTDRIADDLLNELESNEQRQAKPKA